ncbi:MAG TPA: hypothetical protein VL595_29765 [Pseudonocardia sp.]|nr:hypothetical protein [Pseudonocardia sp.]
MTQYVLADLREVGDELARRAAQLTDWLDRAAAEFRQPTESTPGVAMGDLACMRAMSAAAARLSAAADAVKACAGDVDAVDADLGQRIRRGSG